MSSKVRKKIIAQASTSSSASSGSLADSIVNGFRLTLTTGVAVTTSDVIGATTIYCTPFGGNKISLYDGAVWRNYSSSEFSLALGVLTNKKPYDVFCYANLGVPTLEFLVWTNDTTRATALTLQDGVLVKTGAATRRYLGTFYNQGNQTSTVTITNATPAVVTYTAHGLTANAPIVFTTDGALPNGLVAGTTYYIASIGTVTADTFNVSATPGGALINTTTAGSGTHTGTVATYVEDSVNNRYLWNYYNQSDRFLLRAETTGSYTYTTAVRRVVNANQLNSIHWVSGLDTFVSSIHTNRVANTSSGVNITIHHGLDSYTVNSNNAYWVIPLAGATLAYTVTIHYDNYVVAGKHYLSAIEFSAATGTTTWYGLSGMIIKGLIKG